MTKSKAIKEAKRVNKIINQNCYVIKIQSRLRWCLISSWFRYESVSEDYIKNNDYKGKIYFKV